MSSMLRAMCGVLLCASTGCLDDADVERPHLDAGDGHQDGGATMDASFQGDAGFAQCAYLSVRDCVPSGCVKLAARRIDESTHCFAESAGVGCMSRDKGCDDALTLARDPDGGLWQFGSGCTPRGWSYSPIIADGMSYASEPPPSWTAACQAADAGMVKTCAERTASECTPTSCVALTARPLDLAGHCLSQASAAVGCMDRSTGCNAAINLASDPDGGIWQFSSGCIPVGWTGGATFPDGVRYPSSLPDGWAERCP